MSPRGERRPRRLGRPWWLEAAIVYGVYVLYSAVRARLEGGEDAAFDHARQMIAVERATGTYHEETLQDWLLAGPDALVRAWNVFYGLAHFVVPGFALVYLWWRVPDRYRLYRNAFGFMLLLGLAGFALYPLMPPRLLPARYGYVDTAAAYGGIGPIGKAGAGEVTNAYAAMPSLHIGWASWSVAALLPLLRRRAWRALLVAYPLVMLYAVMVTANHYWIDGLGGLAALWGGLALARLTAARGRARGPAGARRRRWPAGRRERRRR